jgi:hypothetical protein
MAMVVLGSLMDYMQFSDDIPCKLIINEPLKLLKKYRDKLVATQQKGSLTLGQFARDHHEWSGEYEWTFSNDGTLNRVDLHYEHGTLRWVSLDITDWLKQQSDDAIDKMVERCHWSRADYVNAFFMHLGRPHLCYKNGKTEMPTYYKQRYTKEGLQEIADKKLLASVKQGYVQVTKTGETYHVQTISPINFKQKKPIDTIYEMMGDTLSIGRKILADALDEATYKISFTICDLTDARRKRLDDMIGLKADPEPEDEDEDDDGDD